MSNVDPLAAHFDDLVEQRRVSPTDDARAVDWHSFYSQAFMFHDVFQLCDLQSTGRLDSDECSVLDVGSGLGDLFPLLTARFPANERCALRYRGIDISSSMVEAARIKHPDAHFAVHDISAGPAPERYDWAIASGTFNLSEVSHEEQRQRVRRALENMLDCTRVGVAAVFLSEQPRRGPVLPTSGCLRFHYEKPGALFDDCLEMTPHVTLRHGGAAQNAFAIVLRHRVASQTEAFLTKLPPPEDPVEVQQWVEARHRIGRLADAESELQQWPSGPLKSYALGLFHQLNGDPVLAMKILGSARHDLIEARLAEAAVHLSLYQYEQVFDVLCDHLEADADVTETFVEACIVLGRLGPGRAAVGGLGNGALRLYLTARLDLAENNVDAARANFESCFAIANDSAAACQHLFELADKRGDHSDALRWALLALARGCRSRRLRRSLRRMLTNQHDGPWFDFAADD